MLEREDIEELVNNYLEREPDRVRPLERAVGSERPRIAASKRFERKGEVETEH